MTPPETASKAAKRLAAIAGIIAFAITPAALNAQPFQTPQRSPNLRDNIDRPLRYTPDGQDFVIKNGGEFFNRPLYGGNTAFRVDAGDMPEFLLYLPGRGGNLRFGIRAAGGGEARWLHETAGITARYRPGEMLYEISDPLLGENAVLRLHAVALHQTDGLVVRAEAENLAPGVGLLAAYGGANGKRGKRDGDIGTEAVPIGEYFQLTPDACRNNRFTLGENGAFTLRAPLAKTTATLRGQFPAAAKLVLAAASVWSRSTGCQPVISEPAASATPILISTTPLVANAPLYFCIQRIHETNTPAEELADYQAVTTPRGNITAASNAVAGNSEIRDPKSAFDEAVRHFAAIRNQIAVDTPDPFINAAVAALNVAADAVWDEPQGAVMHGAIAWRSRLLGWRGPYAMDALGWHDRARRHLAYWATRQNTDPIPDTFPPPEEATNLSRSRNALHSNGDMANSHYDMNTVYIDALFRHFLWTGDLDFAREMWPVIERHLAWQRRLFRREYGPEKLPLYEAYAQIWASDDLQYHGGGVTYATAYNHFKNTQAARLARLLGKTTEAAFYENEAALIVRGAEKYLWLPEQGMYAEFRDLLGLQRAHPSAGLWSFYHAMDSGLVSREQARPAVRYVNTHYPAIPVRGPGVPDDEKYQVLSSTDWMPYTWSVNNVVMGENIHAALALWQADRPEYAFRLTKSGLLASMFMGICPGNVGSLNYLDVYRRESQRDFADGSGVTTRAVVEGLFGIRPDALAGTLTITPGWPEQWMRASIKHPDIALAFTRDFNTDTYTITQNFRAPQKILLQILPRGGIPRVTINGAAAPASKQLMTLTGVRLEIEVPATINGTVVIVVDWTNANGAPNAFAAYPDWSRTTSPAALPVRAPGDLSPKTKPTQPRQVVVTMNYDQERSIAEPINWNVALPYDSKLTAVRLAPHFNDSVTQIFKNEYRAPRSPYVSLAIPKQGIGAWAGHVNETAEIDDTGLRRVAAENAGRIRMPNGVFFMTPPDAAESPRNILFTSLWDNYPAQATIPLEGRARHAYFLMAGSTNWMQSRIDNAELVVTYADGGTARLALRNPDTWWPIDQDLFYDDYQFRCVTQPPPRVDLKTGKLRILDLDTFKGRGRKINGGAATILHLPLDPKKELRSLTLRTLSNEVVVGLMAVTLER